MDRLNERERAGPSWNDGNWIPVSFLAFGMVKQLRKEVAGKESDCGSNKNVRRIVAVCDDSQQACN